VKLNHIYCGDALEILKTFPDGCVDMMLTSPPYWTQRYYSGHPKEIGLEKTPEEYINNLFVICKELKRVLKKSGTFWLNIDDVYYGSGHGKADDLRGSKQGTIKGIADKNIRIFFNKQRNLPHPYLKKKDLCLIPDRLIDKLQKDGWYIRSRVIWYKPNAMPENVKDRPVNDYEFLFLLSKSNKYYFDYQAIRTPYIKPLNRWGGEKLKVKLIRCPRCLGLGRIPIESLNPCKCPDCSGKGIIYKKSAWDKEMGQKTYRDRNMRPNPKGRNCRTVWAINTQASFGNHIAKFPEKLCVKPILAGCPPKGIVLDPFMGSGTVGVVAKKLGRNYIGIELNPEYVKMAKKRITNTEGRLL